jgi:YceI-like domain
MKFKSKGVEQMGDGRLKVTGDLTINATTQEVVLDVEDPSASVCDPRGNEKIGLAASTQVSRKKFGIIWNEAMESGGSFRSERQAVTGEHGDSGRLASGELLCAPADSGRARTIATNTANSIAVVRMGIGLFTDVFPFSIALVRSVHLLAGGTMLFIRR